MLFRNHVSQTVCLWLLVANRPLQKSEILEALEDQIEKPLASSLASCKPSVTRALGHQIDIESVCRGFVTISQAGVIGFSNPCVRENLLLRSPSPLAQAHELVARTCFRILHSSKVTIVELPSLDLASTSNLDSEPLSNLSRYAITNWAFHYRHAEAHSRTLAGILHHTLAIRLGENCGTSRIPQSHRTAYVTSTIFRICTHNGFPELAKMCLEMDGDLRGDMDRRCKTLGFGIASRQIGAAEVLPQTSVSDESIAREDLFSNATT